MKLLLENWRRYLNEGMKTVADLPPNIYLSIRRTGQSPFTGLGGVSYIKFEFTDKNGNPPGEVKKMFRNALGALMSSWEPPPSGVVLITNSAVVGECAEAWIVAWTKTEEGWGPLLYDAAMEWATKNGQGLAPDRRVVSDEARKVWDYYLNNRGDVKSFQLDNLKNTLTPEKDDNCEQGAAAMYSTRDWETSALSKKYTKSPTTLNQLQKMGRLLDYTDPGAKK